MKLSNKQMGLLEQVSVWLPQEPFDVISFDCDATLTAVEGVEVLAEQAGVLADVKKMTHKAMYETGLDLDLYRDRLALIAPSATQVASIGEIYFAHRTPEADTVIALLQAFKKRVYVLSAGILPCVSDFATHLQIPRDHVYAVDCYFDTSGEYSGFEEQSELTKMSGKLTLIKQLCQDSERVMHVGDGMNDVCMAGAITSFVGFGAGQLHEHIEAHSDHYVISNTFTALLPLIFTAKEVMQFDEAAFDLFERGCEEIFQHQVLRKGTVIDDDYINASR